MPEDQINIEVAEKNKLFYVVANLVIVRQDGRALVLKRGEGEQAYPGKWGTIGGNMEHTEFDAEKARSIENNTLVHEYPLLSLLQRKAQQEAGLKFEEPLVFIDNKLILRTGEIPINLMTFAARYTEGEVAIQIGDFTEFAWVNGDEVDSYDCIEGVKQEVKKAISIFAYAGYIETKKQ